MTIERQQLSLDLQRLAQRCADSRDRDVHAVASVLCTISGSLYSPDKTVALMHLTAEFSRDELARIHGEKVGSN